MITLERLYTGLWACPFCPRTYSWRFPLLLAHLDSRSARGGTSQPSHSVLLPLLGAWNPSKTSVCLHKRLILTFATSLISVVENDTRLRS
ncbi:hypothetical protein BDW66DRAFT_126619 [Aspergillus desertorum]